MHICVREEDYISKGKPNNQVWARGNAHSFRARGRWEAIRGDGGALAHLGVRCVQKGEREAESGPHQMLKGTGAWSLSEHHPRLSPVSRGGGSGRLGYCSAHSHFRRDSHPIAVPLGTWLALANGTGVSGEQDFKCAWLFCLVSCDPDFCSEKSVVWSPPVTERWNTGT